VSSETSTSSQNPPRKPHKGFLVIALFLSAMFAGCLVTAAWFLEHFVSRYLSEPQTYGDTQVIPFGHSSKGLLYHDWDSVQVRNPAFQVTVRHPSFQGHLLFSARDDFFRISADSVSTKIYPSKFPPSKKDSTNYEFPNFRIPLRVRVQVSHADIFVDSIGHWTCDSLQVRARGRQTADLRLRNLLGTHVDRFTGIDGRLRWNEDFVDAKITAWSEDGDSVSLAVNAPRASLRNISGTVAVNVADPAVWLPPGLIPKSAPTATGIRFKSSFSADIATMRYSCRGSLRARTSAFWPLPAFDADIRYSANSRGFYTVDATLIDDDGGEINLRGNLDKKLNASVEGSVENISAKFGPQIMPLDLTIHSARKTGDELDFDISTRRNSKVRGKIESLTHNPTITFTADIDENEPWALDWCRGNLRLGSRPQIRGTFRKGVLSAHVEIAPVEYAYKMHADSLAVDLALNRDGIHFTDGFIRGAKDDFVFNGEVMWYDSIPHTSWNVRQEHGGNANAWISFEPEIKVQAENVRIGTIPFADTAMLRGMDGTVTGTLDENFATYVGSAQIDASTEFQGIPIRAKVSVREKADSLYLEKAEFFQDKNKVEMEATAYLRYDSTAGSFTGITLVDAWASTQSFDLPLLFAPFKSFPLRTGSFNGNIEYRAADGFQGNILFDSLSLKSVNPQMLSIPKLRLFAEKEKVEMDGDVLLGNGTWNGVLQVSVDHILENKRHINVSHTVWNGGTVWLSGDLDSSLEWKGELNANGSWFLPANAGEISHTDLHADIDAKLKDGLDGIDVSFKSDSTLYDTEKGFIFPFSFKGTLNQGIVDVSSVETKNELQEKIQAALRYDIHKSALEKFDFHTDGYTIDVGREHEISIKDAKGHLNDSKKETTIAMELPLITYKLKDTTIGHASAKAHGIASLHLPHPEAGSFANMSIDGNILIDKAVFKKQLSADIGVNSFNKLTQKISGFFTRLRHSRPAPVEKTTAGGRPTNIAIHISDSGQDSVAIVSNFATFPLTIDIWALGTTSHPILRGDIDNSGNGFFGLQGLFQFNLDAFSVTWQDVPWQRGTLNISGSENIPYCETSTDEEKDATCPVTLNISGTVTNPQPLPTMDCGTESTPAAVYYSIILGCVAEDQSSTPINRNRIAGKVLGGMLSSTANKAFGGEYVGDIDMKLPLFSDNATSEKDSNYLRIPISLDRWVKNLSLVFGYKQDQSENPTYDQAVEAGLNYTLPVFAEKDRKDPNHYDPRLDFSGNLVSKRYVTALETDESENRLEKNIGFNYSYRFWAPCLLGIGNCPVPETEKNGKEGAK